MTKRQMKKIVIDTRLSGLEHAGIGRYIQSLAERLKVQNSKFKAQGLPKGRAGLKIITISPDIKHYSIEEQIRMPGILKKECPDLTHFPHFNIPILYNKPYVVTIHDLLWHEQIGFGATTQSRWKYLIKYAAYRLVMRHAILKSTVIIVPSNWVKTELIKKFPQVEYKVEVVYEGVAESFRLPRESDGDVGLSDKFKIEPGKYLLYVGSLYPHKNLKIILDVLPEFPELKLVLACARSVFRERFEVEIEKRDLKSQVVLAGFVPDKEMVILYREALAFVFPSRSEGFGLPGLEAMACGCPVISSNAGSLPEIYEEAAEYFDPENGEELIGKIREISDNRGYREELIKKGKERAKQFSWEKCADETLKIYENCLGLRPD